MKRCQSEMQQDSNRPMRLPPPEQFFDIRQFQLDACTYGEAKLVLLKYAGQTRSHLWMRQSALPCPNGLDAESLVGQQAGCIDLTHINAGMQAVRER